MVRKLKKLYFKLYHLFKLIGIFIIIFGIKENVYAEECKAIFEGTNNNLRHYTSGSWHDICLTIDGNTCLQYVTDNSCGDTKLCLDSTKDYTIFATNENDEIQNISTTYRLLSYLNNSIPFPGGLTPPAITKYTNKPNSTNLVVLDWNMNAGTYGDGSEYNRLNSYKWYIVEGTEICIPTPPTPTPQPNETYTNFITLYTDRLNYLAEGFTSNPYLITMIGIIISWVVLELALKLFNLKGGNKK